MSETEHFPFSPKPLPYPINALAPWINPSVMKLHHDSHYAGYIKKLNAVLSGQPKLQHLPIEALLIKQAFLPEDIRNEVRRYAGGVFNHQLQFSCLTPHSRQGLPESFEQAAAESFGSFRTMVSALKEAAMSVFGSGYAYLTSDMSGRLHIIVLSGQETPIEHRLNPLLPVDVWEHAYYLQYQNHRERYLNSLMKVVNWREVEKRYHG